MKVLFISEHYDPVIAGTVTYVKNICKYMVLRGVNITLIVPSVDILGVVNQKIIANHNVIYIGVGYNIVSDIPRKNRYAFVKQLNIFLYNNLLKEKYSIVHILFGPFITEKLDVKFIRNNKVGLVNTIHNVPPEECGISWDEDTLFNRYKDIGRKFFVKYINHFRLRATEFDVYIVPSNHVKTLLKQVIPDAAISVIGHGYDKKDDLIVSKNKSPNFKLLTVGGFVPHKNQHKALLIALELKKLGFDFKWSIVGPVRNQAYFNFLSQKIKEYHLEKNISLKVAITRSELEVLYQISDLYIQPSLEEGFCLTALEAIFHRLPLIGSNTGAIPEIINDSKGILVSSDINDYINAIVKVIEHLEDYDISSETFSNITRKYSWEIVIDNFMNIYSELMNRNT